jgi:hypothetical protein
LNALLMQLAKQMRQLAPERMSEVDRLLRNDPSFRAAGEKLSLDYVSPSTIAAVTAMIEKAQAMTLPIGFLLLHLTSVLF